MKFEIKIAVLKSVNSALKKIKDSIHYDCYPILFFPNLDAGYLYFLKGTEHSIHRLSGKINVIDKGAYTPVQLTGFGIDPEFLKQTCDKLGSSQKDVCQITLGLPRETITIQKGELVFESKLLDNNLFNSTKFDLSDISKLLSPESGTCPVRVNLKELIASLSKCKQYRKELYSVKHKRTEVDRYDGVILVYKANDGLNAPSFTVYNVHEKHEIIYGTDKLTECESNNGKDWIITLDPYLMVEKIIDTLKGYQALNRTAEFIYLFPKVATDRYNSYESLVIKSSADLNEIDLIDDSVVDVQPTLNLVVMGYGLSNSTLNLVYPLPNK